MIPSEPLIITNSELRTWQSCPRKWYLSYYLKFAPDPSQEPAAGVLHLGSLVHLALEAFYGYHIDPLQALDWAYGQDILLHPGEAEALEKELALAKVMTGGYLDWVATEGVDAGLDILGCEIAARHHLVVNGTPVILQGRLDQLARRKSDGALIARDFKTVGSLAKAQLLRISSQLKFYALLQALEAKKEGGIRVAGGEYLLILRTKRTSRAVPPFYASIEVPLNRHELNAQYLITTELVRQILEIRKRLDSREDHHSAVPPHYTDACGWGCPFLPVCQIMDDGSRWGDMLEAKYARSDVLAYYSDDKITTLAAALGS